MQAPIPYKPLHIGTVRTKLMHHIYAQMFFPIGYVPVNIMYKSRDGGEDIAGFKTWD